MPNLRNLALAGILATSGCAGSAQTVRPPQRHDPPRGRTSELATETCPRQRTTRIQECMIEGIAGACRERTGSNQDAFYSCMQEGLSQPVTPAHVQLSITVGPGEEVFSLRVGGPAIYQIVKLDATTIDSTGVNFNFSVSRVETVSPAEVSVLDQTQVRMNYDGSRTGEWLRLNITEIWNFRVENADGRARVSFETDNPAMVVRGAAQPSTVVAPREPAREQPLVQPPVERPPTITSPD